MLHRRILWLSAGEIPLAQHMVEAGKRIRAGQELRMVDISADAGVGLGLFPTVHDHEGSTALAAGHGQGTGASIPAEHL